MMYKITLTLGERKTVIFFCGLGTVLSNTKNLAFICDGLMICLCILRIVSIVDILLCPNKLGEEVKVEMMQNKEGPLGQI